MENNSAITNDPVNPFLIANDDASSCHMGDLDRIFRLDIAITLAIFGFFWIPHLSLGTTVQWTIYGVAALIGLTGLVRHCPLYPVFGINTNRVKLAENIRIIVGWSIGMQAVAFGAISYAITNGLL